MSPSLDTLTARLEELRLDLIELAFAFDRRGRSDAADVATQIAERIGRLLDPTPTAGGRESAEHAQAER